MNEEQVKLDAEKVIVATKVAYPDGKFPEVFVAEFFSENSRYVVSLRGIGALLAITNIDAPKAAQETPEEEQAAVEHMVSVFRSMSNDDLYSVMKSLSSLAQVASARAQDLYMLMAKERTEFLSQKIAESYLQSLQRAAEQVMPEAQEQVATQPSVFATKPTMVQ